MTNNGWRGLCVAWAMRGFVGVSRPCCWWRAAGPCQKRQRLPACRHGLFMTGSGPICGRMIPIAYGMPRDPDGLGPVRPLRRNASSGKSAGIPCLWATTAPAGRCRCGPITCVKSTAVAPRSEPGVGGCTNRGCAGSVRGMSMPPRTPIGLRKKGACSPDEADATEGGAALYGCDPHALVPAAALHPPGGREPTTGRRTERDSSGATQAVPRR